MDTTARPTRREKPAVELYRDPYLTLIADPDGFIIRLVRTREQHPSPQAMLQSFMDAAAVLDQEPRWSRALLIDMRDAVGRNEPEYDAVLRRIRPQIEAGFVRVGVLLRTSTGLLQMKRVAQEEATVRLSSASEAEVMAYLRHGVVPNGAQLTPTKPPKATRGR